MDGVHPLLVCAAVEWRWRVLLLAHTVQWCDPCPAYPSAVLISTAVVLCAVLLSGVRCAVVCCGVCMVFVWWGILCLLPPLVVVVGWRRGWWGGMVMKGGCCDGDLPV